MMDPKLLAVLAGGGLLLALAAQARGEGPSGFLDRVYKDADGTESKCVVFVPRGYKPGRPTPTILFLHGLGESGTDGKRQVAVGLGPAVKKREKTFPFLVIFPQAHKPDRDVPSVWRADRPDGKRALASLDAVEKEFSVDRNRLYLTGLSMGGFGTWALAASHPDRWAAIAPICGGGDPADASKIKHLPCWCFHGDADNVVPVDLSRRMIKALRAAGAEPTYDEYAGVGHNSWDKAYDTAGLYDWLLQQKRSERPPK
jgi:predicted peptidase